MDLWAACRDHVVFAPLAGELVRVVESQEQIATNRLVDSLAEQALLEELIEQTKPHRRDVDQRPNVEPLHYLLATPFRYPPLPYGSRFGTRSEPGVFYASQKTETALAETAYYRFVFWSGMAEPPPSGRLVTQHTLFGARYDAQRGIKLQASPFDTYRDVITHPGDYRATQGLGSALRNEGVEAFEYVSARDPAKGINVALFTPAALGDPQPHYQQAWLCETQAEAVTFAHSVEGRVEAYPRERFLVEGVLPVPAV